MNNPEMQNAMQQLMADPGVRQAMEQQVGAWLLLPLGLPCLGLNRNPHTLPPGLWFALWPTAVRP